MLRFPIVLVMPLVILALGGIPALTAGWPLVAIVVLDGTMALLLLPLLLPATPIDCAGVTPVKSLKPSALSSFSYA